MSGADKKRAFPYYTEVQGFDLQRRRLEDDPSRWVGRLTQSSQPSEWLGAVVSAAPWCRYGNALVHYWPVLPASGAAAPCFMHTRVLPSSVSQGRGGAAGVAGTRAEHF